VPVRDTMSECLTTRLEPPLAITVVRTAPCVATLAWSRISVVFLPSDITPAP